MLVFSWRYLDDLCYFFEQLLSWRKPPHQNISRPKTQQSSAYTQRIGNEVVSDAATHSV